jgi:uncharacterized protein (TIGR02118 family)
MASVIVQYSQPEDPEGFAAYYRDSHLPLADELPDVVSVKASRILGTPRGGEAPYFLQTVLTFESMEKMGASLQTEAGAKVSKDAMEMCQRFGTNAEIMLADDF